jgi:hypothetical protein
MEAKWFGEDRVYRLYLDGKSVLLVYAGQFQPKQIGLKGYVPDAVRIVSSLTPTGLVVNAAVAYGEWIVGKEFDKRAVWLDAMSLEELRVEAHNNDASRILTASTTSDIHLGPPVTSFWSNDYLQSRVTGRLTFKHLRKTWELAFFTPDERNFALRIFREALGKERVTNELLI